MWLWSTGVGNGAVESLLGVCPLLPHRRPQVEPLHDCPACWLLVCILAAARLHLLKPHTKLFLGCKLSRPCIQLHLASYNLPSVPSLPLRGILPCCACFIHPLPIQPHGCLDTAPVFWALFCEQPSGSFISCCLPQCSLLKLHLLVVPCTPSRKSGHSAFSPEQALQT